MQQPRGNRAIQATGGTSESAPLTAGVAALVIQAYREAHGGATPDPGAGQAADRSNADDIGAPADQQGAGFASTPTRPSSRPINYGVHRFWPHRPAVVPGPR